MSRADQHIESGRRLLARQNKEYEEATIVNRAQAHALLAIAAALNDIAAVRADDEDGVTP